MKKLLVILSLAAAATNAWAQQAQRAAKDVAVRTAAVASSNVARAEAAGAEQAQPRQAVATTDGKAAVADSAANAASAGATRKVPAITREVFSYDGGGRRDPFVSLARNGELRPYIADLELKVVTVATDKSRAIAMIRDKATKEMYQVKIGDSLGRYRVVNIDVKSVTFAIEEFGFSRQEKLAMTTSSVRNQ